MKYYTEDHEWVEVRGDEATVGISSYAVEEMGEVTYIELPLEDDDVIVGDTLGLMESVDVTMHLYSPLSGTIAAVNDELEDDPSVINDSPEEEGWICKLINIDSSELDDMMNETDYRKYLRSLKR